MYLEVHSKGSKQLQRIKNGALFCDFYIFDSQMGYDPPSWFMTSFKELSVNHWFKEICNAWPNNMSSQWYKCNLSFRMILMKKKKKMMTGTIAFLTLSGIYEPPHEKTNNLQMRKQKRRSASR